jgi:hypothetical protein
MQSVFNAKPPSFTADEISKVLKRERGLDGDMTELFSDRDQIFLIDHSGVRHIVKVSNPIEDKVILDLQSKAVDHISKIEPTIQVPKQMGPIIVEEKNGQPFMIRILRYIEGNFLSDSELSKDGYERMGIFIGRLTNSLHDFEHPGAHRKFHWDARHLDLMEDKLRYIHSSNDRRTIEHFLNEFEKDMAPLTHKLRMSIIHNDGNDHNILVNDMGETIGIIDFGDMVYSYTAMDPAVCMAYINLNEEDALPYMAAMLSGYRSTYPLNDAELMSMVHLMCLRLCVTVLMASWRKRLFPENEYLVISEAPAWRFLRKMQCQDLNEQANRLTEHAR